MWVETQVTQTTMASSLFVGSLAPRSAALGWVSSFVFYVELTLPRGEYGQFLLFFARKFQGFCCLFFCLAALGNRGRSRRVERSPPGRNGRVQRHGAGGGVAAPRGEEPLTSS